jgi:tetratricopeptide (TPR) repeat protein
VIASTHERQQQVLRLMQEGNWHAANEACRMLTAQHPSFVPGWYLSAQLAMRLNDAAGALQGVDRVLTLEPAHPAARLLKAQCLLAAGQLTQACAAGTAAQESAPSDPAFWDALGQVFTRAGDQYRALAAYEEALRLAPGQSRVLFNRAAVRRFVGDLAGAETDYDQVIALDPSDFEAYRNRSDLRGQTAEKNHVTELERVLAERQPQWRGEVQLRYALAKEYEDLGEYGKSFQHLRCGARLRREHLRYDVKTDIQTVDWIMGAFSSSTAALPGASPEAPIFIVGLPRSGSTLVERILGSHSQVAPAGELECFARALTHAVRRTTGHPQLSRQEMVASSTRLDFSALGRDYLDRARAAGATAPCFTDKMPLNYLYCGLIHRALPNAKIVHVSRSPMAACYAIHKTLFEAGYPFSYDLDELSQYYVGYRRLMDHWRRTLPGAIHDLSYETLIADQLGETRQLLQFCGLQWEDACVEFHRNPAATTTASASQVRRPLYLSSVSQWRHYETHLAGLRAQLEAAGIDTGD